MLETREAEHVDRRSVSPPAQARRALARAPGPAAVLRLQRAAGNRAVVKLLRQAAAQAPSRAWNELYTEMGRLETGLVKVNASPPVWGERTDESMRLTSLMAELGDPATTSDARVAEIRQRFTEFKADLEHDREAAVEWWAELQRAYEAEDKRLARSTDPVDGRAREILAQRYRFVQSRLTASGQFASGYDVQPLAAMLTDRQHITKAVSDEVDSHIEDVFEPPTTSAAGFELEEMGALRKLYVEGTEAIKTTAKLMLEKGGTTAEVAQWTVEARNALKVRIRNEGARIAKVMAALRNVRKYGNPLGPTYEELRAKGRTDAEILESATRGNASISRWAGRLRIAGGILIAFDIGVGVVNVAEAPTVEMPRVLLHEVGRIGGGLGGAVLGAKVLGTFGEEIGGPWGGGIGALAGGVFGGFLGAWGGSKAGDWIADKLFPPQETRLEGHFE